MQAFLTERETLLALKRHCRRAKKVRAALALVTLSGFDLLKKPIKQLLSGGGELDMLLGIDMATEPRAIEALLELQDRQPDGMRLRRFATGARCTFHPKVWIFSPGSDRSFGIVGSSNLTLGGLDRNYEANLQIHETGVVGKLTRYFDELFEGGRAKQIDRFWLDAYTTQWKLQQATRLKLGRLQQKVKSIQGRRAVKTTAPSRIRGHAFAFTGRIDSWPRESKLYPVIKKYDGEIIEFGSIGNADCLVHRYPGRPTDHPKIAFRSERGH